MYRYLIKPILFFCDPEWIHYFVFSLIRWMHKIPGVPFLVRALYQVHHPKLEKELFGIRFKNPVGLAAGFDKDARLYRELSNFGFGCWIGTIPPNPAWESQKAFVSTAAGRWLINRMGFNNDGVDAAIHDSKKTKTSSLGATSVKIKLPPMKTVDDYTYCFKALYPYVDYFVVNVSSPNTRNLRALQEKSRLPFVKQSAKAQSSDRKTKPILLKIAPELTDEQLLDIIDIVKH